MIEKNSDYSPLPPSVSPTAGLFMTAGEAESTSLLILPQFYQSTPLIATGKSGLITLLPTILTKESHLCSTN